MKFELKRGMIIIRIEGAEFVVDTAATVSGTFLRLKEDIKFDIKNKRYLLNYNEYIEPIKYILDDLLPDNRILGVIGTDIISENNLTIDYLNNDVWFDLVDCPYDIEKIGKKFEFDEYIFITLPFNGKNIEVMLDSLIDCGSIKKDYINFSNKLSEKDVKDMFGDVEGELYWFNDSIHGDLSPVGILPKEYENQIDGVLSLYEFVRSGYCQFDFNKMIFRFTRRFL